jgi:dTDP-4-dehydrorhamnose reductase
MKTLLITGASGFLGWNLCRVAGSKWHTFGTFFSHSLAIPGITMIRVDLRVVGQLKALFKKVKPDAVVHTAALTDPNFCQDNPLESYKINVETAVNLSGLCSERRIPCIFTSSDLIFNGLDPPYREEDTPSPVSVYGEHKVLAEEGMKACYPPTVICRLPLMFGDPGPAANSFIQPLIKKMESGDRIHLFTDEYRTPVSGKDAADGIMLALNELPSRLHLGGIERVSRYEFGRVLSNVLDLGRVNLNPCRQKDLDMSAPRPHDVSLDSSKAGAMGFQPDALEEALRVLLEKP